MKRTLLHSGYGLSNYLIVIVCLALAYFNNFPWLSVLGLCFPVLLYWPYKSFLRSNVEQQAVERFSKEFNDSNEDQFYNLKRHIHFTALTLSQVPTIGWLLGLTGNMAAFFQGGSFLFLVYMCFSHDVFKTKVIWFFVLNVVLSMSLTVFTMMTFGITSAFTILFSSF